MFFRSAMLVLVLAASCMSFGQESTSHPPKHFNAPNETAIYDESGSVPDQDLETLKKNLRLQKKQIVAANMNLTDTEAEKFWPVYDRYAADLASIYDTKMALVGEYLGNYKMMGGDEAESYIRRRAAVEEEVLQLRVKYVPEFRKVLSGRQTALFFELDWRLDLVINMQLAKLPVIDP